MNLWERWKNGKALENYAPGKKIGGAIFQNKDLKLPDASGRTWYEADIGIDYRLKRSHPNNPGYRIVYLDDGLIFGSTDHYESFFRIDDYYRGTHF